MTIPRCRLTHFEPPHNGILVQILTFACRHIHSGFLISLSVNSTSKSKLEFLRASRRWKKSGNGGNANGIRRREQEEYTRWLSRKYRRLRQWRTETSIFATRIRARNPPSASIVAMPRGSSFLNRYPATQIRSACRFLNYKMHDARCVPEQISLKRLLIADYLWIKRADIALRGRI